jgi:3-hydroxy-9,10-secoandrosta-1,3,5(10)-triene-9,17-dione monooxygenase reductase component
MRDGCLSVTDEGVDATTFRSVMGRFATGVTIVTTRRAGKAVGMTVNAFTSVSLVPPLVLVCLHKESATTAAVREEGAFAVNVLGSRHITWARRFAGPHRTMADPFHDLELSQGRLGLPLLAEAEGQLECRLVAELDGGDHAILVGHVLAAHAGREADPLLFHLGSFRRAGAPLLPPRPPVDADLATEGG